MACILKTKLGFHCNSQNKQAYPLRYEDRICKSSCALRESLCLRVCTCSNSLFWKREASSLNGTPYPLVFAKSDFKVSTLFHFPFFERSIIECMMRLTWSKNLKAFQRWNSANSDGVPT